MIQMRVDPGDPAGNLARARIRARQAVAAGARLLLYPEAMDCGWAHGSARELAGPVPGGAFFEGLAVIARDFGVPLCAGLVERDGDHLYNAAVLIGPDGGLCLRHRKIHELEFARALYDIGDRVGVVVTPLGRLGLMVCADAFAPGLVVSRACAGLGAEVILSPCAWAVPPGFDPVATRYGGLWMDCYGEVCRQHGITIAGCSNVGVMTDGPWTGHGCIGSSLVVGPGGGVLARGGFGTGAEEILLVPLPGGSPVLSVTGTGEQGVVHKGGFLRGNRVMRFSPQNTRQSGDPGPASNRS